MKPPTISANLENGPLAGRRVDAHAVEGRPPKIIDVSGDDGRTYRYGLAEATEDGQAATYAFMYGV